MLLKCEIDRINTLKNGMKITLHLKQDEAKKAMATIVNFMDKPVTVELLIDADKQKARISQVSAEQRAKIFALMKDMASYTGDDTEELRIKIKQSFINATGHEDFSLSNCSKEIAGEFIEYLLTIAFELGVNITDDPKDLFKDDLETYTRICLENMRCVVCNKPAELAHYDTIGMGNNRNTLDDSDHRKYPLCRKHHTEEHTIGRDSFCKKYHVVPIIWNE